MKIRILDGAKQIWDPMYGWMTWDDDRQQWQNSEGYMNFPPIDNIDYSGIPDMSLDDLVAKIEQCSDGGVNI